MSDCVIRISEENKCKRCGKGWATENGYCLKCIAVMVKEGKFDHILKRQR